MLAERPDNVIALAPYRMAQLARRKAPRPYLMWYPNVGFLQARAVASPPVQIRPSRVARAVEPI